MTRLCFVGRCCCCCCSRHWSTLTNKTGCWKLPSGCQAEHRAAKHRRGSRLKRKRTCVLKRIRLTWGARAEEDRKKKAGMHVLRGDTLEIMAECHSYSGGPTSLHLAFFFFQLCRSPVEQSAYEGSRPGLTRALFFFLRAAPIGKWRPGRRMVRHPRTLPTTFTGRQWRRPTRADWKG